MTQGKSRKLAKQWCKRKGLLSRNAPKCLKSTLLTKGEERYRMSSGPGGYSTYPWVGSCGAASHTLTLFKTNIADFPTLFKVIPQYCTAHLYCARFSRHQRAHMSACSCKTWRICLDIVPCQLKNGYSAPTSMGTPTFFLVIVINLS